MCTLPVGRCAAAVQTLVPSGVRHIVDGMPGYGDPTLLWTTTPDCHVDGPRGFGMPGDELLPALISRASLSIATPRPIFSFNPTRPESVCNPYRLLSNVFAYGPDLYFVDNQGTGGQAALQRLRRDAKPGDVPQLIADLGTINGASLIIYGSSVTMIVGDDTNDRIVSYDKDTGAPLGGTLESSDRGRMGSLKFDGRYLYWTNRGALRRADSTTDEIVTAFNGPVNALYVFGYDEFCDPDGCTQLSRIIYSQENSLYEADSLSGTTFNVYTSPIANARIYQIDRGPTEYYFIETRPVGTFERDERFFRLSVGDDVPDLIYGPINNGGPGFEGFHSDFEWLYFVDRANESLLRLPIDEAAIPVRDLRATRLEVTQGLQNRNNDLRLMSEKRTVVRFSVKSGKPEDVYGVTAQLSGSNARGFLGRLEPVNAGGKLITVRPNPTRTNLDHSFQFELPRTWLAAGHLSLTATINPAERIVEDTLANNSASAELDITQSPRLLVIYYNWAYDLGGARRTPVATDVAASRLRMRRLYPLGEPGDAFESPGLHTVVLDFVDNELTDQVDRTDAACVKRYEKKPDDRNMCASDYVHGRMKALRKGSGIAADAVSYGNIAQAPAPAGKNYFTRGYADGQYASGPSTDVNYAAHEVGHTLGRDHPFYGSLKCGHSATDNNYPYSAAYIDDSADVERRFQGLNFPDKLPGTTTLIEADSAYDTMAYCSPNWISDYTFEGMYQYLISDARPRAAAPRGAVAPGDWLIVNGTLTPADGEGGFVVVQRTDAAIDAEVPEPGDFTLELRDSAGDLLNSYLFAGTPIDDQPGKFAFDVVVPFEAGVSELRAIETATQAVLATHEVSANPPLVTDVQLVDAPDPVDGVVTVTWTGTDPDGDPLRFDVFALREGDPMLRPLHLGIDGTSVALDTAAIAGGINRLRVVASDGAQTSHGDSAPFTVLTRAPKVTITAPVDGSQVDWGQLVSFQAEVDDLQDAHVPDAQIAWISDKTGRFATGRWAQVDSLPVGENVIEVRAINSLEQVASATIRLNVGDALAPAGATLSVAPQSIGWHADMDDDATQVATVTVDNHGTGTLEFDVTSDASWLLVDSAAAVTGAEAPRVFTITAAPMLVPPGLTSRATLTFANINDPDDVVVMPVELSRGNVFDHTGGEPPVTGCTGDCDGDGMVGISELIRGVNIALGNIALSECTAFDRNDDGQVGINELIGAVNAALFGC